MTDYASAKSYNLNDEINNENLTVDDVISHIVKVSVDQHQKGTSWELAVRYFLQTSPEWKSRFTNVWMWNDSPTNPGSKDIGIDLVAQDTDGEYWAIQAKCYKEKLSNENLSTFFANALADKQYNHYIIADTAPGITSELRKYINKSVADGIDIVHIDKETISCSNIDWRAYLNGKPSHARKVNEPRDYQREAIDAISAELKNHDRALAVMACGTGKTLTSLRFAEEFCGFGTVLFLAPSISLVSQTMKSWVNQVREKINVYVVCSDGGASNIDREDNYGQISDIPSPATTNAYTLVHRFKPKPDALNVVFSTYQSIQVLHDAQEQGLPDFDLVICDEAHRTTGLVGEDEGYFQKVHDNDFLRCSKRLYMTATPRIYDTSAKRAASLEGAVTIASMDDEKTYGRMCYHLGFGKAVEKGILTDYKIVVMQISQDALPKSMQQHLATGPSIEVDDQAKFVGIWKALFDRRHANELKNIGKHAIQSSDDAKRVLHHAIAFASSIKASKQLSNEFQRVIRAYTKALGEEDAAERDALLDASGNTKFEVDHVDGSMDSSTREKKLKALAAEDGSCHILSNARCLAEGINVPALDAIIYLSSRKSRVEIIQSVGRVMRKADGKEFGYIILPIFVASGVDPSEALASSDAYKIVWRVVNALRGHDERLEAKINAAALGDTDALNHIVEVDVLGEESVRNKLDALNVAKANKNGNSHLIGSDAQGDDLCHACYGDDGSINATQGVFEIDSLRDLSRSINAQIVRKCGTKVYWNEWTQDVAQVTTARAQAIDEMLESGAAVEEFNRFLQGLRNSLNSNYSREQAVSVLAQHEITRPIFESLFNNPSVIENNPIVKGMNRALESLYLAGLPRDLGDSKLQDLYASVKMQASQVVKDSARQNLVKEIYNDFFSVAFNEMANELGIVYTPVEVVDAQLHMVNRALKREFGLSLGNRDVHVLDGFAGTGTYICRLIEDESLIPLDNLTYKYEHDLHSNEIVPLASMIMDVNIEQSYHARVGGEYKSFAGALLADTFQMYEPDDPIDTTTFSENTERVEHQLHLPIRVIVGNPPYRSGDKDNTGNQNTKYEHLDKRIEETYVKLSNASLNGKLYDHYIRAFRWASDRIEDNGVICFVSNGGWLTSASGAGMRKAISKEFNSIYVYNLRGNQRTQGEESRKEGGKIFASGSRATIAITMLVKNTNSAEHGVIHYCDIGDYLTREDKFTILKDAVKEDPQWQILNEDEHGDWLNKRDSSFDGFIPMGLVNKPDKMPDGLFKMYSLGVATNRDAWVWNMSLLKLQDNVRTLIDNTNNAMKELQNNSNQLPQDTTKYSWSRRVQDYAKKGTYIPYVPEHCVQGMYRPFTKSWLYFDSFMNERTCQQPRIFPIVEDNRVKGHVSNRNISSYANNENAREMTCQQHSSSCAENMVICVPGKSNSGFNCFISNTIVDLNSLSAGAQCFPLYWYEKVCQDQDLFSTNVEENKSGYVRHDAITDEGLAVFQAAYSGLTITKEDIFYYVYGVLHSSDYRSRFANNLQKDLPRIPLAQNFLAFKKAGEKFAKLHLNYEKVKPWDDIREVGDSENPGETIRMKYPRKIVNPETGKKEDDLTVLQVSQNLVLENIPLQAYRYVVNGKSAIKWLIERYQVAVDKKTGIVRNPNEAYDNPRYIVDLVKKVVRVSVETMNIIDGLPKINEITNKPDCWPDAWN